MHVVLWWENLLDNDRLEDQEGTGRITLKLISGNRL
jgi:hypothetical protein